MSPKLIPGAGRVNSADPPPEIKTITKSFEVRVGIFLSIVLVASIDEVDGRGWSPICEEIINGT